MKEIVVLSPVAYFSPHFNTRKDKACCPAFVFSRGAFNVFWDLVLYLMNEGLNILLIYGTMLFQYLKTVLIVQDSNALVLRCVMLEFSGFFEKQKA